MQATTQPNPTPPLANRQHLRVPRCPRLTGAGSRVGGPYDQMALSVRRPLWTVRSPLGVGPTSREQSPFRTAKSWGRTSPPPPPPVTPSQVVERIVEVPQVREVEVPVEKVVEVIHKVPEVRVVEVALEKVVEKMLPVDVHHEREVPVEKIVEKIVTVPELTIVEVPRSPGAAPLTVAHAVEGRGQGAQVRRLVRRHGPCHGRCSDYFDQWCITLHLRRNRTQYCVPPPPTPPRVQEPACARTNPWFRGAFPDTAFFRQRTGVSWLWCTKGDTSGMQENISCVWHDMERDSHLWRSFDHVFACEKGKRIHSRRAFFFPRGTGLLMAICKNHSLVPRHFSA